MSGKILLVDDEQEISDLITVMVQIRHIREKLNDIGEKPKFIKTIWWVGYIVE